MAKKTVEIKELRAVQSSNISMVGYNDGSAYVSFSNGNIYRYDDVPIEQFHELAKADSVGQYFAKTLRSHEKFEKLENTILVKRQLSDEEMENEILKYLRNFSENKLHEASTGVQRISAKRILKYVLENS